jgi:AraC-like DNA-binding protein
MTFNPSEWRHFLDLLSNRPPLVFVHGMRHAVPIQSHCEVHSHAVLEIIYHPIGQGVTNVDGTPLTFDEGSVVIHPPDQTHDQRMDIAGEDLCVKIATHKGGPSFPHSCLYLPRISNPALIEDLRLLSEVGTALRPTEQILFNLRATGALLTLIDLACRRWKRQRSSPAERYVTQAEQYLREHFSTVNSLQDVADAVGISLDYLRHQFQKRRGQSLVRYVSDLRIERAKTLLVHSQLPLKQVATLCGFRDEYYFSRVFRRNVRSTPGTYRSHQATR